MEISSGIYVYERNVDESGRDAWMAGWELARTPFIHLAKVSGPDISPIFKELRKMWISQRSETMFY